LLTNLTAGFTPFTSWVGGYPYELVCKRRCMDNRNPDRFIPTFAVAEQQDRTKAQAANWLAHRSQARERRE
jgi:hypothetical protein